MTTARRSVFRLLVSVTAMVALAVGPTPAQGAVFDPWRDARSMSVARAFHTATLLLNGRVLVAGGISTIDDSGGGVVTGTTELYTPATNTWRAAAPMLHPRAFHTAVRLKSGRVLVVGGSGADLYPPPEIYTPWTNQWTAAAPTIHQRSTVTATLLLNGKVFVFGADDQCGTPEIYTPWTNTWAEAASIDPNGVAPCAGQTAVRLLNGRVLIHGGTDSQGAGFTPSFEYRPITDSWFFPIVGSPFVHFGHAMTLLSTGRVLLAGGTCRLCTGGDKGAWLYSALTSSWTSTGPMTFGRESHVIAPLSGGRALVAGGFALLDPSDDATLNGASAEVFDPSTGLWTRVADMHTSRIRGHSATLLPNGRVLLIGGLFGSFNGPPTNLVESFG
jgi:hypothetical protein